MRHKVEGRKLGRVKRQRVSLMRNLTTSLILHERIVTTTAKAKSLKPKMERLITIAKKGDLNSKQRLMKDLFNNQIVVRKLMKVLAPKYMERTGGYLRVVRQGTRVGDAAPTSVIEFV